jgi:glycosyltransferase involved in cell wall biosynthesis
MRFTGYVQDLGAQLRRHRIFVAPVTEGGGIKTKLLDAMANGVPVVATTLAVSGIGVVPGRDALVADSAEDFAAAVLRACAGPTAGPELAAMGAAGRALVAEGFATAVLVERWRSLLAHMPQL